MRSLLRLRWLAALALWLGMGMAAHATHVVGQELTYTPITSTTAGIPRYQVKVRLYRDALSAVDQPEIILTCAPSGCATTGALQRTVLRSQSTALYTLGGPTAPAYTYNVYSYETDVDLPRGQWTLSVTSENRAADIRNLFSSINTNTYVSAFLDNTLVDQNSSPKFLSTLLPYLCGSQAQRYSFSAFDSDGDSLVYSLVYPQQGIPPTNQCGTAIAGTLAPHFRINAATGALTAQAGPVQQGRYAMAARVDEYRLVSGRWQLIGNVTRDITYLAFDAANVSPRFMGLTLNAAPTPLPVAQQIRVQPGQTINLVLSATDPDAGQTLRFASQAPGIIPGLSLSTLSATQAQLTWHVPATLPPGRYTATVAVLDSGCPVASEEQTISFWVTPQALATHPALAPATSAFPMPFREQVHFQAGVGAQVITICDGLGRVVARLSSPADGRVVWTPAPTLPPGLYVARAADGRLLARLLRAAE